MVDNFKNKYTIEFLLKEVYKFMSEIIARDDNGRGIVIRQDDGTLCTLVYNNDLEEYEDESGWSCPAMYVTTFDSKGNKIEEETADGSVTRFRYNNKGHEIDRCNGNELYPALFDDEDY